MSDQLSAMAELIRLRAKASEPLDIAEMFDLADALENYGYSVTTALRRTQQILQPPKIDIPPLPPFHVIVGGRT